MDINKIIEGDNFDKLFYEGERNSVFCKKHKIFATPSEIKNWHKSQQHKLLQSIVEEIDEMNGDKLFKTYGESSAYNQALSTLKAKLTINIKE